MSSLSGGARVAAIETSRHERRETDTSVGDVLTDIAKRVLWQENTAPCLAAAVESYGGECSVRQAERYLGGHSEYSGDAVAAIMSEILKRRGMRNVKVIPKR